MTDLPPEAPPASDYDAERDSIESYYDAIRAIGEAVRAGAPLPACFVPREASA